MPRAKQFGELLTTGIYKIKLRESNKPITVIHDELGYALGREGGSSLAYWRQGNVPADIADIELLARLIVRRGELGVTWLNQFLKSAGHPDPANLQNELFEGQVVDPASSSAVQVVDVAYPVFVGRSQLVNEITSQLVMAQGPKVVAIDGIGGIGKTALAKESARLCIMRRSLEKCVWIGAAKGNHSATTDTDSDLVTYDTVLNKIGEALDIPDVSHLSTQEKTDQIKHRLQPRRILVVLDNLDTANDAQHVLVSKLTPLLGNSRAIVTSRYRFAGDVYAIHLLGLEQADSMSFIRHEAELRRIKRVMSADQDQLVSVWESTGGSPLALKLVVGQLAFLPLQVVLNHLKTVRPLRQDSTQDEYLSLYKSIFFPSWGLATEPSQKLLVQMSNFVPGSGGSVEAIRKVSDLSNEELLFRYINELWQLSFLDVTEVSISSLYQIRYSMHSLTRHFVLSDIVRVDTLDDS